jgi:hypothetical protein
MTIERDIKALLDLRVLSLVARSAGHQSEVEQMYDTDNFTKTIRYTIGRHFDVPLSPKAIQQLIAFSKATSAFYWSEGQRSKAGFAVEDSISGGSPSLFEDVTRWGEPMCHEAAHENCGTHIFTDPDMIQEGYLFARFGLVCCFLQVTPQNIRVVTNLPVHDPLPTLVDYALFSAQREALLPEVEAEGVLREAGCLYQMSYGWDNEAHNLRNQSADEPFEEWLPIRKALARDWLAQTTVPPQWHAGISPYLP